MERAMLIGSRGLGFDMRSRVQDMNLEILTSKPLPDFPREYSPHIEPEYGAWNARKHVCEEERVISLPGGILVFDVRVSQPGGYLWQADHRFDPYYTGSVLILHEGMQPPDSGQWRPLNTLEGVCGLAQNLWVGSLRYYSVNCTKRSCQAYRRGSTIVVECHGSSRGHHAAYTTASPAPPYTRMVRV